MKACKSESLIKFEMTDERLVSELYKFLTTIQEYGSDAAVRNIVYTTNISYSKVMEVIGL